MRQLASLAAVGLLAILAGAAINPVFGQQAGSAGQNPAGQGAAGQGTGFSMTPPITGYGGQAPAAPVTSVPMMPAGVAPAGAAGGNGFAMPTGSPATPPASPAPGESLPATGVGVPGEAGAPAPTVAPFQMVPGQPAPRVAPPPVASAPPAPQRPDLFIVPQQRMIFAGEVASRAWVVYVTEEEAARQATFLLSYLNAVVVMPETSRIRVALNGQTLIEAPIASSQSPSHIAVPVQRGTLRAGANLIRIDVVQRHRTDCAVSATYELWTELNNAGTGLSFTGGRPPLTGGLDDLPSVGFDDKGITTIRVITPGPIEGGGTARVLRVVQGLSVRGQYPNPAVVAAEGVQGPTPPGALTVVIGTASELPRLMATVPPDARQRPITSFLEDDRLGAPVLVISGPTPADVDRAIDRLNAVAQPPSGVVETQTRVAPNTPLFDGARSVRLAELGVVTQEFSGRRFRSEFQIALPPDFYAEAYGNATLLLDAAFTAAVRPGSHIDVYVNQQIASTLPITTRGGGLFQHAPMFIPLRNFRPGINRLWLEVVLDTESDTRCLPGATLPADNRFVLFDTSEFALANFARIGRMPDLAAFSATSFPYNLDGSPLAVVLARQDAATLSAASTLMSRLALVNGAPLPIDASPASVTLGERNAIFVGGIDQISSSVLAQVGIAGSTRSNWVVSAEDDPRAAAPPSAGENYDNVLERFRNRQAGEAQPLPSEQPPALNTPQIYERWRDSVQGRGGIYLILDNLEAWLKNTFSISFDSLRIPDGGRAFYEPPPRTSVLMAQGNSSNGARAWTLVTGRTAETLAAGMVRFTADTAWNRIGGQAVAFQSATGDMERHDAGSLRFIVTEPLGFANFRMIAANWLSTNIVPYALMLLVAGTVLGIATAFLLRRLGRPT